MKPLTIDTNKDHVFGSVTAPLEVIEYGDYECPYCGIAYPIVKSIQQKLGPEMRFAFRNFPLSNIHPHAFKAAVAAEAAGLQQKFWEMHDIIFENQKALGDENILQLAQKIGLNSERFKKDILEKELAAKVEMDFESGIRFGVNGTPSFFANGKKYGGELDEEELLQFLVNQITIDEIHQ